MYYSKVHVRHRAKQGLKLTLAFQNWNNDRRAISEKILNLAQFSRLSHRTRCKEILIYQGFLLTTTKFINHKHCYITSIGVLNDQ